MQAVILVGGEGTRLRPLTSQLPKPVLDVIDRPFLAHMLDWLSRHGVDRAIISCGFKADALIERLGTGVVHGVELTYVQEPEPRGTAGALKFAEEYLDERFLMLNGDVLTDLDLSAQLAAHAATPGATGTLGLVPVADPSAFGLVRTAEDGTVVGFVEKPKPEEIDTDLISAGAYVLERSVLDLIPAGENVSIERAVFPLMVGNGLYGFAHRSAYFMDLGTPERYLDGSRHILDGSIRTAWHDLCDADGSMIHAEAEVEGTVIAPSHVGPGAKVAAGAVVGPYAVLGAGVQLGAGSILTDAVALPGAEIGERVRIERGVIGHDARVGDGASVSGDAIIGPGAELGAEMTLSNGERIAASEGDAYAAISR